MESEVYEQSEYAFIARLDRIKVFTQGVRAINFGENARFNITDNGVRITSEHINTLQASLFITKDVFESFELTSDTYFSVNMHIFSECLNLFSGMDCAIKLYFKAHGHPLEIIVEYVDEDVNTEINIKTAEYEEPAEYFLNEDSPNYNIIFIRGPDIAQIFSEIDKSAEELEFTLSPKEPYFRLATVGVMQSESNIEIARNSDMILLFNCRGTTTARYKFSHIRQTLKALAAATKVAIKTDSNGLLEMQFMLFSEDDAQVYVQFFVLSVVDGD